MNLKKHILSFLVGVFVIATLVDVSKVMVTYSIYYVDYYQAKEECYNESPDMFQADMLFLKALIKRVNDICPNHKPKPPVVENSNLVLFFQDHHCIIKDKIEIKLKNRFVYSFNYDFSRQEDFFHPPISLA